MSRYPTPTTVLRLIFRYCGSSIVVELMWRKSVSYARNKCTCWIIRTCMQIASAMKRGTKGGVAPCCMSTRFPEKVSQFGGNESIATSLTVTYLGHPRNDPPVLREKARFCATILFKVFVVGGRRTQTGKHNDPTLSLLSLHAHISSNQSKNGENT